MGGTRCNDAPARDVVVVVVFFAWCWEWSVYFETVAMTLVTCENIREFFC